MVKEIIKSIVEAEAVAQSNVDEAILAAKALNSQAEAEVEKISSQLVIDAKLKNNEIIQKATSLAIDNADNIYKQGKQQADEQARKFERGIDLAVEEILKELK